MENTTTELALIPVQDIKEIMDNAPEALQLNTELIEKAVGAGERLLAKLTDNGMDDATDKECNDYLVKLRERLPLMKSRREPVTKMFDRIRSVFTALEKQIDPKEKESIYSKVQKQRDDYAAKKMRDQQERERQAQLKLAIEREKIELKASFEMQLQKYFSDYLIEMKTKMNNHFEALTLDTFAEKSVGFTTPVPVYSLSHFNSFSPVFKTAALPVSSVSEIIKSVTDGKYELYCNSYKSELTLYKSELAAKLPAKKAELEAIVKALRDNDEAEQKRLAQLEVKRKADEDLRLQAEQEKAALTAKSEAEAVKAMETTNAIFDAQIESQVDEPARVREGYAIELKHPTAYLMIVSFYFEREGKTKSIAELEKKTLGAMVTFCEKVAAKSGEKIESPYIVYTETFKTTAKK